MTHRIKEVKTLENFVVSVIFQDGVEKEYDVKQLFSVFPQFQVFETESPLFKQVTVDVGGCGISWNDELDLAAEEVWDNGLETGVIHKVDILSEIGVNLTKARDIAEITQKELAEKTHIYQGDISKIERGSANPSVKTLQRLAEGMDMVLKIEFVPKQKI
jgi:DNA-binding XRE family transcriptional regulator